VPAEAFPIGLPDGAKLLKELKKLSAQNKRKVAISIKTA
jgi:hypothetical protein